MATDVTELGPGEASSSWPDLPPELLGVVLLRLPSIADRVRLAAACRSWRSGVRLQAPLPSPAPWLVLGDRAYLDLGNGAVNSVVVPGVGGDCCCRGSFGDWLFLTRDDGGDCFLVNPFSGAEISLLDLASFLPKIQHVSRYHLNPNPKVIQKVVAMAPLSSSTTSNPRLAGPVVAALIKNNNSYDNDAMFVCRARTPHRTPATPEHSTSWFPMSMELWLAQDIEFFHGKLYVLVLAENLAVVKVKACRRRPRFTGKTTVISCSLVASTYVWRKTTRYLVDSGDRLLMVKRLTDAAGRTYKFEVFEAELGDGDDNPGRWKETGSLRGRALFVSKQGSKSVPVAQCPGGGGVVQEDCIYFIHEDNVQDRYERRPGDPLADSGVYNLRNKTLAPFPAPETTVPRRTWGRWMPTWLFPTQVR